MEYTTDLEPVQWLKQNPAARAATEPLLVKHLLPERYPYIRALLPAVGIIEGFPFDQVKPDSSRIEQINRNVAIWTQHDVYRAGRTPVYQPTSFRQLAARFALPYNLDLLGKLLWRTLGFATLAEPTAAVLLDLLLQLAPATTLNLYVEDSWRWGPEFTPILPTDEEVLYRVTAREFIDFLQQAAFDATAYLFPDARNWCLVNVEDGLCPIIGGHADTEALIAAHFRGEPLPLSAESEVF
ncbi:hypothetical protein [Hymenobacter sp. B81]|uniref:hypothetical protein n=1 Tax=Hymenobacter sp. B81 TaxID=3344878 RepID=UPI0037DC90B0